MSDDRFYAIKLTPLSQPSWARPASHFWYVERFADDAPSQHHRITGDRGNFTLFATRARATLALLRNVNEAEFRGEVVEFLEMSLAMLKRRP